MQFNNVLSSLEAPSAPARALAPTLSTPNTNNKNSAYHLMTQPNTKKSVANQLAEMTEVRAGIKAPPVPPSALICSEALGSTLCMGSGCDTRGD
jgi:hypothetical protein